MFEIKTEREVRRSRRLDLAVNGYRDDTPIARTYRRPEVISDER